MSARRADRAWPAPTVGASAISLLSYLLRGASDLGVTGIGDAAFALAVPVVVAMVWLGLRRLRRRHGGRE
jgi:uncharacterized membrane-anchored protein